MDRRKPRLGPPHDLHGGAVQKQLSGGRPPNDLIHQIVGSVGGVGYPASLEVEGGIVAIIIAAPAHRPVQETRSNIHHLRTIVDEGVSSDFVAFRAGGEMYADLASLEP